MGPKEGIKERGGPEGQPSRKAWEVGAQNKGEARKRETCGRRVKGREVGRGKSGGGGGQEGAMTRGEMPDRQ